MKQELENPALPELLNDTAIANALGMSKPWVRQQRYKRLHKMEHVLALDPVYVGRNPRYHKQDFIDWLSILQSKRFK